MTPRVSESPQTDMFRLELINIINLRHEFHLVKLARQHGVTLRQSYWRCGQLQSLMVGRYARAKQFRRMRKATRKLKTYLGRVSRDIQRKIAGDPKLEATFSHKLLQARQLLTQHRKSKNKLYSLHAPEVECIGKGKAHKAWEFGVKVGVVTTVKEQFVLASHALPGTPYNGHTLYRGLVAAKAACGVLARNAYVDRGYRGHMNGPTTVWIAGQKRGVTAHRKQKLKRRNAIEAIIGHMKTDGWLSRNHLLGRLGDATPLIKERAAGWCRSVPADDPEEAPASLAGHSGGDIQQTNTIWPGPDASLTGDGVQATPNK